jgi:hypothetical protein
MTPSAPNKSLLHQDTVAPHLYRPAFGGHHRTEQDPRPLADPHLTTDDCVGRNVYVVVELWGGAVVFNQHSNTSVRGAYSRRRSVEG